MFNSTHIHVDIINSTYISFMRDDGFDKRVENWS